MTASEKREKIIFILFIFLCASVMALAIRKRMLGDSDFAFILYEGRRIARGGIQHMNGAASVSGLHIIVQQWLYALIFYKVYELAGWNGIYAMTIMEMALFTWIAFRLAEVHGCPGKKAACIAVLFGGLYVFFISPEKPEIITECLLMTEMALLEKHAQTGKKRFLAFAVLTVPAEANLHASMWGIHVITAVPYMIPCKKLKAEFRERKNPYSVIPVLVAASFMCLLSMASPYGIDGALYLFNSVASGVTKMKIGEIGSPELKSGAAVVALVLAVFAVKRRKHEHAETLASFAIFFIMFILSYRNFQFLFISAVPTVAEGLDAFPFSHFASGIFSRRFVYSILAGAMSITVAGCYTAILTLKTGWLSSPAYPKNAIGFLKTYEKGSVKVMTTFNTGAYMENAGYRIFVDARPEIWNRKINKKTDVMKDYQTRSLSYSEFLKIRNKYGFQYVMADRNTTLKTICDMDTTMKRVAEDRTSVMYKVIRSGRNFYY